MNEKLETRVLSSLSKVFSDEELTEMSFQQASALQGETYAFQVAYRSKNMIKPLIVRAESTLGGTVAIRTVGLAPSELPCFDDADADSLRTTPGLYPDPLYPPDVQPPRALPGQWRAVWVTVDIPTSAAGGTYPVRVLFEEESGDALGEETFRLTVVPQQLPKQRLIHTEWFHADCIATYYGCPAFSEEHWRRLEQFIGTAAAHGINMLLTPLFTPPLDTEIGGERPTVQLVDVTLADGRYSFGFDRLKRWVELALEKGIEYFEFSHLFTQWGAKHAPKIVAIADGEERRIFGWETDAAGEAYRGFLNAFLPELVAFIKANGLEARSYFHVSDEPSREHLEQYRTVSAMLREHLSEFPMIDALSDYAFHELGLVEIPVPANDHIESFLEHGVDPLWTYYCVSQRQGVSNRFFHMPSSRNRIIGLQLYKYGLQGFLHWGYNFWNSQYSRKAVDPFRVTDADMSFPSGDSFLVYPGEDGPIESIRLEVFAEALQDLRAMELLESRIGKEAVVALIEDGLERPITFSDYPRSASWLLEVRERVNGKLADLDCSN
nr:glycoside hydrolase domain-containing protein [Paenibacillus methanolicus]